MPLGANSIKVHGDTSVFLTTGTANNNQHLEQAKHKLGIGHPHTAISFSPLRVKHGGTNAAL